MQRSHAEQSKQSTVLDRTACLGQIHFFFHTQVYDLWKDRRNWFWAQEERLGHAGVDKVRQKSFQQWKCKFGVGVTSHEWQMTCAETAAVNANITGSLQSCQLSSDLYGTTPPCELGPQRSRGSTGKRGCCWPNGFEKSWRALLGLAEMPFWLEGSFFNPDNKNLWLTYI